MLQSTRQSLTIKNKSHSKRKEEGGWKRHSGWTCGRFCNEAISPQAPGLKVPLLFINPPGLASPHLTLRPAPLEAQPGHNCRLRERTEEMVPWTGLDIAPALLCTLSKYQYPGLNIPSYNTGVTTLLIVRKFIHENETKHSLTVLSTAHIQSALD